MHFIVEPHSHVEPPALTEHLQSDGLGLDTLFHEELNVSTSKRCGLNQVKTEDGAARKVLLAKARAGKKVQVWQGKGKWMGLANISLRSPGLDS